MLVVVLASGCAMSVGFYRGVEQNVSSGRYDEAALILERNREEYARSSDVLYHLEMGLVQHYGRRFEESSRHFFDAERRMQELYTKSVSTEAGSFAINDNLLPYEGEDHEKVLVNLFLALNFAEQGAWESALVEARKADVKLREYARAYEGKNSYKEDAFIRYVMGVLYEAGGELNDAFISYRNAYEAYGEYERLFGTRAPSFLGDDLLCAASILGFEEEREAFERRLRRGVDESRCSNGSLFIVVYSGKGAIKEEVSFSVSIPDTAGIIHTFAVAVPKFRPREYSKRRYEIEVGEGVAGSAVPTEVGEDITAIAAKALDDRIGMIYLKSGGRAVMKFLAAEKAKSEFKKKEESEVANLLFSAVTDLFYRASEEADVRSWRTLPDNIQIARVRVQPGNHRVRVSSDEEGLILEREVEVKRGAVEFVIIPDVN